MEKRKRDSLPPAVAWGLGFVLRGGFGVLLMAGLVLLSAVLIESAGVPRESGQTLGFVAVTAGGFAAGVLTAVRKKTGLLPAAGVMAAVYCFELLLLGAILCPKTWLAGNAVLTLGLAAAGCLAGTFAYLFISGSGRRPRR